MGQCEHWQESGRVSLGGGRVDGVRCGGRCMGGAGGLPSRPRHRATADGGTEAIVSFSNFLKLTAGKKAQT